MGIRHAIQKAWDSPTFTTWGKFATRFLGLFLVLPLILARFPAEEVSCYYLFISVGTIAAFLETGFASTYIRLFSYAHTGSAIGAVEGDDRDGGEDGSLISRLLGVTSIIQRITLSLMALMLGVIGTWSLVKPVSACAAPEEVWWAWGFFAAAALVRTASARDSSAVRGIGEVSLANRWDILFNSASVLVTALVLTFGGGLREIGIVQLVFAGFALARYMAVRRRVAGGRLRSPGGAKWDSALFREIWNPTWRQILMILLSTGVVQASGIILAQVSGGQALASYLLAIRLITVVSEISQAPFYAHLPGLSALRGQGDTAGLARRAGLYIRRSLLAFIAGVMAVGLFAPAGLELIGAEAKFVEIKLWLAIAAVWLLERHHAMHAQIVLTTNRVPFVAAGVVTGLTNLALMLVIGLPVGPWGFVAAHAIANLLLYNWLLVRMSLVSLGEDWRSNLKPYVVPVLGAAAFASVTVWILSPILASAFK